MSLEAKIRSEIEKNGHITMRRFMEAALFDSEHGYYITKNPIGVNSDFITSPEITVLFGEMIGLFTVQQIKQNLSAYDKINLIECGAGKGTMMKDVLDCISGFNDIYQKIKVYILEINPVLVEIQKKTLSKHIDKVEWIGSFTEISGNSPHIYISNEFFDALPVSQYVKRGGGFKERVVTLDAFKSLEITEVEPVEAIPDMIIQDAEDYEEGAVVEYSPEAIRYMREISDNILKYKGFSFVIDYGYTGFVSGDTVQSVYLHEYNNIFKNIGAADITAHVNFRMLYLVAMQQGIKQLYIKDQGDFFREMGIVQRAHMLAEKLSGAEKNDFLMRVNRIHNSEQMGTLFKCFIAEAF